MKQEILRHKKLNIFVLFFIFFVLYFLVIGIIEIGNRTINLGVGIFISQIIVLYIYLMFILRTQLLYYEYSIIDDHLIVKEFLSRREKTLVIIPLKHILSVESEQQHKNSYYNKIRKVSKRYIKNTKIFFVEYDDYADISLLKMTCSQEFIKSVCIHI